MNIPTIDVARLAERDTHTPSTVLALARGLRIAFESGVPLRDRQAEICHLLALILAYGEAEGLQ